MSGKYTKKKKKSAPKKAAPKQVSKESAKKQLDSRQKLQFAIIAAAVVLVIVIAVALSLRRGNSLFTPQPSTEPSTTLTTAPPPGLTEVGQSLGYGLEITDIGGYTGAYMEDGSDEVVSGVLMIVVANNGEEAIQYAELYIPAGDQTAFFRISTLLPGEKVVLLDMNRLAYTGQEDCAAAELKNVARFSEMPSLQEDKITVQTLDGAMNITNVSGEDITGDIVIYYKNCSEDLYYGGITYMVRISGGLQAGEIRQIMASHYNTGNSRVVFVTVG